jgi:hypothetical protein
VACLIKKMALALLPAPVKSKIMYYKERTIIQMDVDELQVSIEAMLTKKVDDLMGKIEKH